MRHRGTPSEADAAQSTRVLPNSISTDPAGVVEPVAGDLDRAQLVVGAAVLTGAHARDLVSRRDPPHLGPRLASGPRAEVLGPAAEPGRALGDHPAEVALPARREPALPARGSAARSRTRRRASRSPNARASTRCPISEGWNRSTDQHAAGAARAGSRGRPARRPTSRGPRRSTAFTWSIRAPIGRLQPPRQPDHRAVVVEPHRHQQSRRRRRSARRRSSAGRRGSGSASQVDRIVSLMPTISDARSGRCASGVGELLLTHRCRRSPRTSRRCRSYTSYDVPSASASSRAHRHSPLPVELRPSSRDRVTDADRGAVAESGVPQVPAARRLSLVTAFTVADRGTRAPSRCRVRATLGEALAPPDSGATSPRRGRSARCRRRAAARSRAAETPAAGPTPRRCRATSRQDRLVRSLEVDPRRDVVEPGDQVGDARTARSPGRTSRGRTRTIAAGRVEQQRGHRRSRQPSSASRSRGTPRKRTSSNSQLGPVGLEQLADRGADERRSRTSPTTVASASSTPTTSFARITRSRRGSMREGHHRRALAPLGRHQHDAEHRQQQRGRTARRCR